MLVILVVVLFAPSRDYREPKDRIDSLASMYEVFDSELIMKFTSDEDYNYLLSTTSELEDLFIDSYNQCNKREQKKLEEYYSEKIGY